jgi:hypothetical protein
MWRVIEHSGKCSVQVVGGHPNLVGDCFEVYIPTEVLTDENVRSVYPPKQFVASALLLRPYPHTSALCTFAHADDRFAYGPYLVSQAQL